MFISYKYVHEVTGKLLVQACPGKGVVRWTDRPDITLAVDWDVKQHTKPKIFPTGWYRVYEKQRKPWSGVQA